MRATALCAAAWLAVTADADGRMPMVGERTLAAEARTWQELSAVTEAPGMFFGDRNPYNMAPAAGVDPKFECAWRRAAYKYGKTLQTMTTAQQKQLSDALQLGQCAGGAPEPTLDAPEDTRMKFDLDESHAHIFVHPTKGSDNFDGTRLRPLESIQAAVEQSRTIKHKKVTIALMEGTHYLAEPVLLTPKDSGLTISSFEGGDTTVSGARPIKGLKWEKYKVEQGSTEWIVQPGINDVYAATTGAGSRVSLHGKTSSATQCEAACKSDGQCNVWTWHDSRQGNYAMQCWFRSDGAWETGVPESGHTSGYRVTTSSNIWAAKIPADANVSSMVGLRLKSGRAQRARFPNANSEIDQFPVGWIKSGSDGMTWAPVMHGPAPDQNIEVASPNRSFCMDEFQMYEEGKGGCCAGFTPAEGYWCSSKTSGGGAFTYRIPSGVTPNSPYKNAKGAILQAWRPGHWASWMFEVDSHATQSNGSTTLGWELGGFQGARGSNNGAEWFVENVFEELDAPNEFFLDEETATLYLYYNATAGTAPPSDLTVEATHLMDYFKIEGTPPTRGGEREAVVGVSFKGLTIKDAAATYMEPHGMPSGGDWGLQRRGAIYLENTENVTIEGCLFTRNDGNAVMLSGYNRGTLLKDIEAVWNGDSVFAAWGYTDGIDGTSGEQPRGTLVDGMFCHELGQYEKQSSCWFQAKAALTEIKNSIMFNGPRAMINFNDGFGGGNIIHDDLLFNSCRESSDHGPFNSWDRQPYMTEIGDGTASLIPKYNIISNTFMVANYGANGGCIDNDDGSSWYNITNNFFIYGGHKSDFQGHNKRSYGNVNAYPGVYGPRCVGIFGLPVPTADHLWDEAYSNNKCIAASENETYIAITGKCDPTDKAAFSVLLGNNEVWAPSAKVVVSCGKDMDFAEWSATGLDPGTVVKDSASLTAEQIVQFGLDAISKK